jgi:hypothetical protein
MPRCTDSSVNVTAVVDAQGGAVSAVEVVLNVSDYSTNLENIVVTWDGGFTELPDGRVIQMNLPLIRFAAMNTAGNPGSDLAAGSKVIAKISFKTVDLCSGSSDISGATWPSQPPLGVIQTQFVDASDNGIRLAPVTTGTVSIKNALPVFTNETIDVTLDFGDSYTHTFAATDADVASCETKTFFTTTTLPANMTFTSAGVLTFITTKDNICFDGNIVVGVRDKCGAEDINTGTVHFCVKNSPPVFADDGLVVGHDLDTDPNLPDLVNDIAWQDTFTFQFYASDPDPGPYKFFHVISGPGTIDINTGLYTWDTDSPEPFGGDSTVTVQVIDSAKTCTPCSESNSAEYTFHIRVFIIEQIKISKEEDVYLGQERNVYILATDHVYFPEAIGGFDFLIQYDASVMMFQEAKPGELIRNDGPLPGADWEYFTYRFGYNGNCGGGACPSGILRVVAMGETTGGNVAEHPDTTYLNPGDTLVDLHFLVSSDANLECQYAPIRFVWYDCGDNGISNLTGTILYVSKYVWDYNGEGIGDDITGLDSTFPTLTGVADEDGELFMDCGVPRGKGEPKPMISFGNGGLDIICADSIDAPGDINMNDIGYEIADAVMFTNYFIKGITAFGPTLEDHQFGSIAASDTNKDGITLSVADLVYLIRVIVGDALPYNKVGAVAMYWTHDAGIVSAEGQVGGAALVVDGDVEPQLLVSGMSMDHNFDGQVTRIVVVPDVYAGSMNSFNGAFLSGIDREIVSIEMATPEGQPIAAKNIPTAYEMSQNYPNPFNPSTKINVSMKDAGDYSLTIYNVQGQVVQVISGSVAGPERLEITWDASNLASGVYFYKLTAGNFTDTKKAVFLK